MSIEEHINEIREGLRKGLFSNEAAVSNSIVRRLLDVLGWPIYSPQVVIPEYPVEGGRVDFALCHPELVPRVFIEVKQVGNIEGADEQLFGYAFRRGVPIAVLTDGQKWIFYHPTGEGDFNERKVYEIDLVEDSSENCAKYLQRYLNYQALRTGEAIQAIRDDSVKVVRQRKLPEAWNRLMAEADELLIKVVADKTERLCGHKPTREEVLDFLRGVETPPFVIPEVPPSLPISNELGTSRRIRTRLVVTMPDGERVDYQNARDTFAAVIEKLGVEKVKALEYQVGKIPLIATTDYDGFAQRQSGQYYIMVGNDTEIRKRRLEEIADQLGMDLKVEIVAK